MPNVKDKLLGLLEEFDNQDREGFPGDIVSDVIPKALSRDKASVGRTIWEGDIIPVGFREFVEGKEYLNTIPLTEEQYKLCEILVGCPPEEVFSASKEYVEAYWEITKGGGKNEMAADIKLYLTYLLESLRNPRAFLSGKSIEEQIMSRNYGNTKIMLVSSSFKWDQAINISFERVSKKVLHSPWFNSKFRIRHENKEYFHNIQDDDIREEVRKYKKEHSLPWIIVAKDHINLPKQIKILITTGNPESGEGGDVIFFYLDEASGFQELGGINAAESAHIKLQSSAVTRFKGRYVGIVASYRRYIANDFIHDLVIRVLEGKQGEEECKLYATIEKGWKLLPREMFEKGFYNYKCKNDPDITLSIPVDWKFLFDDDEKRSANEMQYLGVPPASSTEGDPFVSDLSLLDGMFEPNLMKRFDYISEIKEIGGNKYIELEPVNIVQPPRNDPTKYIITYDTSRWHNRTVAMLMHKELIPRSVYNTASGRVESQKVVCIFIDGILVWYPNVNENIQISLNNLYQVLVGLARTYNVISVASDCWDPSLPERFIRAGINSLEITSTYRMWYPVKDLIIAGLVKIPAVYRNTHIGSEIINDFKRLEVNMKTGKIKKAKQYRRVSTDFADCIKLGVHIFINAPELMLKAYNVTKRPGGTVGYLNSDMRNRIQRVASGQLLEEDNKWISGRAHRGNTSIRGIMRERSKLKGIKKRKPMIK